MFGIKRVTGAADLAAQGEPGSWVSDAAREKFMAAYERVFALWPQPCEEFDIETATAITRVHAYRPHPGGAPVVLLTGAGGNAAAWYPHVAALAEDGWIAVDHRTFATKFENVYAVGDVTSAPVPRVGAIAEGEARTLAEVLVHQIKGGEPPAPYQGTATCYIEFGGDRVARFDANFLSGPTPTGSFTAASEEIVASKLEFGAARRRRWFGID